MECPSVHLKWFRTVNFLLSEFFGMFGTHDKIPKTSHNMSFQCVFPSWSHGLSGLSVSQSIEIAMMSGFPVGVSLLHVTGACVSFQHCVLPNLSHEIHVSDLSTWGFWWVSQSLEITKISGFPVLYMCIFSAQCMYLTLTLVPEVSGGSVNHLR